LFNANTKETIGEIKMISILSSYPKPLTNQAEENTNGDYLGCMSLNSHYCNEGPTHYSLMVHLGRIGEVFKVKERLYGEIAKYPNLFTIIRKGNEIKGYVVNNDAISDYEHKRWLQTMTAQHQIHLDFYERSDMSTF
jgi:hypothetical protein